MSDASTLKSLLAGLKQERQRGKTIRVGLTISILALVVGFMLNLYNSVQTFDTESLLRHLETRASRTIWPIYEQELEAVARDAGPAITAALEAESAALLPKISERSGRFLSVEGWDTRASFHFLTVVYSLGSSGC